jgi:hypothetical protein
MAIVPRDVQNADVEVGAPHPLTEGQHSVDEHGGDDDADGGQQMHPVVSAFGDDVLFSQHLDAIGHRLEDAPGPPAIGTWTVLDPPDDLALAQGENQHRAQPDHDENETHSKVNHGLCSPQRQEPIQPGGDGFTKIDEQEIQCIHCCPLTSTIEIASNGLAAGRPPTWTPQDRPRRQSAGAKRPTRRGFNRQPANITDPSRPWSG